MKAIVRYDKAAGSVRLMDVDLPAIDSYEVLVQINLAGVCGTDVHIYHDRYETRIPLILGHEFAGTIVKVGPDVADWHKGDRLVLENNPCACHRNDCPACSHGNFNICPQKRAIGFKSDGCFAQYMKAPTEVLHRIPDALADQGAALAEPAAVAVHATVERGSVQRGDTVAIFGPGCIGLICGQVALAMGAAKVTVIGIDRDTDRLSIAEGLGMESINSQSAADGWKSALGPVDLVIEASGSPHAITDAFEIVRPAGRIVPVGITGRDSIELPWNRILNKETTVAFSYSSKPANWEMALELLAAGRIDWTSLITATLPLSEWQEAFRRTEEADCVKMLLEP